jgi:uncharacterized protein
MQDKNNIINLITNSVNKTDPGATLILYGSYARGDNHEKSDLDLLVLIDKEKISREDEKRIKYPLYDIEFETGIIISPMIFSKQKWQTQHEGTPFYENITGEGQVL